MSTPIQLPPTKEILHVCDLVEESIARFLITRDDVQWGGYEAQDEAHLMLLYCIRCIEGISTLARYDLVLLPAALAASRTASDVCIKAMWMLHPEDVFEREARWLALAKEETDYYDKSSKLFRLVNTQFANNTQKMGEQIKSFYDTVKAELTKRFPGKYKIMKHLPNIRTMLKELDIEPYYWHYVFGSQYTHGSFIATSQFRQNYGVKRQFGEFMEMGNWAACFEIAWSFFYLATYRFFVCYGQIPNPFCNEQHNTDMLTAIRSIK